MIRDSRVKFKVSRTNIFQETKKSRIVIISRAPIYTKIPQTALNFTWKWINNKPVYDLLSSKNRIFLVLQHGSALDPLRGGESQLPQTPAAFNTPFFSRITIENLIQSLIFHYLQKRKLKNSCSMEYFEGLYNEALKKHSDWQNWVFQS